MKNEATQESIDKVISERFPTTKHLVSDLLFQRVLSKEIQALHDKRLMRGIPPNGARYKRNWYDRMSDEGTLTSRFFLSELEAIWNKQSSLNSESRKVIAYVCEIAFRKTLALYLEMAKQAKEPKVILK